MSRRLAWLSAALAVVLVAGGGYAGLVLPRQHSARSAAADVDAARLQLDANRALAARAVQLAEVRATKLFTLERSVPDRIDMQGVVLTLAGAAQRAGVQLLTVSPGEVVPAGDYSRVPVSVGLAGGYGGVEKFLDEVHGLVGVDADGGVDSTGRLFTVDSVQLSTKTPGLPALNATVALTAYVLGGSAAAPPVAGAAATPAAGAPAPTTTAPVAQ